MKVLKIEWVDSEYSEGWSYGEMKKADVDSCITIGILLRETKLSYVITSTISADNSGYLGCVSIPKVAVVGKVKTLKL